MRQCKFMGDHYGALALEVKRSPEMETEFAKEDDTVGCCYTWGNTHIESLRKKHGKTPESEYTEEHWEPEGKEKSKGMEVDEGNPPSAGAGFSVTSGGAGGPSPFDLYECTWSPGPLLTPLLARDANSPDEFHWTRSLTTYTFEHLLSESYLNCTLTQILKAWMSMPKVYMGSSRGTRQMIGARRSQAEDQLRKHMQELKDLLGSTPGGKARPSRSTGSSRRS